jgi:hypothetical protein
MCSPRVSTAGLLVAAALTASGCGYAAQHEEQSQPPATVEAVDGSDESRIILSADAADRIGLKTAKVETAQVKRSLVLRGVVLGTARSSARVWIRVPIGGADYGTVDGTRPARVLVGNGLRASVVTAPPPGIPAAQTGALYLSVKPAGGLRQGQRVRVRLELTGGAAQKAVPYSAVIYWIDGVTWVYVRSGPLTFIRRPVVVDSIEGDVAVLSSGPPAGAEVVKTGGVELLGTEFEIEGE